jgi:hypothetical protein
MMQIWKETLTLNIDESKGQVKNDKSLKIIDKENKMSV